MSFIKEAGDSLLRYTEKIVNKTEEYAKIGKITLDIKRLESLVQKTYKDMGEYTFNKLNEGSSSVNIDDVFISEKCNLIKKTSETITQKRSEIEDIRQSSRDSSTQDTTQSTQDTTASTEINQEGDNRDEDV